MVGRKGRQPAWRNRMSGKPEDILAGKNRPFTGAEYLESLRDGREIYVYGERVADVTAHPAFRWENPNKVYALCMSLAQRNAPAFHRVDGEGYRFLADAILKVDAITPQVAARLATAFGSWRRHEPVRRHLMQSQLQRMRNASGLSPDLADIVQRSLAGD
jgi:aminopeptidase N